MLRKLLKIVVGLAVFVIVVELVLTGLFFAGITADQPLLQTRFEQDWGLDPPSELVFEDSIPHRSAGYVSWVCRTCTSTILRNVSAYADDGMRLDGFNGAAHCNVAVFGDGFTNAIELSVEDVFTSLIERRLRMDGYSVNFMNFGLSNAGTTAQYLRYRQLIETGFEFDHVVLVFNTKHNVGHNSPKLNWSEYERSYPYLVLQDGDLVRRDGIGQAAKQPFFWPLRRFLSNHSHVANLANRTIRVWLRRAGRRVSPEKFSTPLPPEWEEAWQVTEKVLTRWAAAVRNEGSSLSALILDDGAMLEPTPRSNYRRQRVKEILDNLAIDNIDLLPIAIAYIEKHAVGPPYLVGQGHYGPLGHRLMADAITPLLRNKLTDCRR